MSVDACEVMYSHILRLFRKFRTALGLVAEAILGREAESELA